MTHQINYQNEKIDHFANTFQNFITSTSNQILTESIEMLGFQVKFYHLQHYWGEYDVENFVANVSAASASM